MNRYYDGWEENECWTNIARFPNHEFSTNGRIRNKRTGHVLRPHIDRYGYQVVSIGNVDNVSVHRVICEAWAGPPPFPNAQVNHIDCDRQNNHIFNLEWVTPSENIKWALHKGNCNYQKGLNRALEVNKTPVRIVELDIIFDSVKDCAEYLKVQPTNVSRCLAGVRKGQRLRGYHVEYIEREEV